MLDNNSDKKDLLNNDPSFQPDKEEFFEDIPEADMVAETEATSAESISALPENSNPQQALPAPDPEVEESVFEINPEVIKKLSVKPPNKYKFKRSIGYGGMKTVLEVRDKDSSRDIAMAVMPDAGSRPPNELCRFLQEARILACLEHPNIVPIHDIGIDSSGSPYFTMKLLKGETLASILKKIKDGEKEYVEKYDLSRLLQIFLRVSHAVAFAHSKQIIHLDLKPENIQVGDFGEVVVLDWGLAKVLGLPDKENFTEDKNKPKKKFQYAPQLTLDGVTKGTPGYMAPEQAAGRNNERDKRTDIYSLGAILYAILTLENPIAGNDINKIISDTLYGNIIPPKERAPERFIPGALEAVVQKAMALDPDERYQNILQLRDEIYAFIGGFCTTAEKAGRLKRVMSLIKRHKVTTAFTSIIIILLLILGSYALYDQSKQTAEWIKVYEQDFTKQSPDFEGLVFLDKFLKTPAPKWSCGHDGLKMEKYDWLWFDSLRIPGDVKVVVRTVCAVNNHDAFEICVNSKLEPVQNWWNLPDGYAFQIAAYGGTKDLISRNEGGGEADVINLAETKSVPNKIQDISVQREGDALTLTIDKKEPLKVIDMFPPTGFDMNRIGIRTLSPAAKILSITVYRLALPEKASPLIAGDTLVEGLHFNEAISKYITIAENYGISIVAEQALARAYITAATKLSENREKNLDTISEQISRFPKFRYREMLMEVDSIVAWREKNYRKSLNLVEQLFRINTNTNVVIRLLECPHSPLSSEISSELLYWVSKTKNLKRLNLSNLGLSTLDPLRELPLIFLDCSNNQISSIEPLKEMELETLSCANNQITSIKPLKQMPLRDLNISGNQLTNIDHLTKMPLRHLDCSYNQIDSIDVLKDMPLERLNFRNNKVAKLDVLKNMPLLKDLNFASNLIEDLDAVKKLNLEKLNCANNKITSLKPIDSMNLESLDCSYNNIISLEPLAGMKLETLDCSFTNISSIQPLRNMPLKSLNIFECMNISDINTLEKIRTIEKIGLPSNIKNLDFLKQMPELKQVHYYNSDKPIEFQPPPKKNE